MYVVGTAGHVDHGKSTLIASLTGINPDRLKEEQDRQMTIDLGFAWHTLPSGKEIGIVDVPGHRDFIDNMLAGVGGIDAVLFVVAADEGVMPQSREHLNILNLLGIEKGLIVLTKIDQVEDDDWFGLVESDIRGLTNNTFLQDAPIVRVSAVKGIGLENLSEKLDELLDHISPKRLRAFPRLPIDRVFTLKGFGTIVTGTLIDGSFSNGDQVVVMPAGIETRIRSMQTHKKKQSTAYPGNRTAINLVGVEVSDIERGDVLCFPDALIPTNMIDIQLDLLKDCSDSLKHDDEVKIFIGTAQSIARVRVIGSKAIDPGGSGFAQLMLMKHIVCRDGDRFILRRPSPQETIGGGSVINANPVKRHKRFTDSVIDRFMVSAGDSIADQILLQISENRAMTFVEIANAMELPEQELQDPINEMLKEGSIVKINGENNENIFWYMTVNDWIANEKKITTQIDSFHKQFPLRIGIEQTPVLKSLDLEKRVALGFLSTLIDQKKIQKQGPLLKSVSHNIILSPDDKKSIQILMNVFKRSGYKPPSVTDVLDIVGAEIYQYLLVEDELIEISANVVFLMKDLNRIIEKTRSLLASGEKLTVAEFRDAFDTTRKYAVALLEFMDDKKITKRMDDFRILNIG